VIGVIVLRDALLSPPVYAFLDRLKSIWLTLKADPLGNHLVAEIS
jgi:hypothetical protein